MFKSRVRQTWWQMTHLPRSDWREIIYVFLACVAQDTYVMFMAKAQAIRANKRRI